MQAEALFNGNTSIFLLFTSMYLYVEKKNCHGTNESASRARAGYTANKWRERSVVPVETSLRDR